MKPPRPAPRWLPLAPLLLTAAVLSPLGLGWLAQPPLIGLVGEWWWLIPVVAGQLLLFAALWLVWRGQRPNPTALLEETARALLRLRNVRRVLTLTTRRLVRCLTASHATIYLQEATAQGVVYRQVASSGMSKPSHIRRLELSSPLVQWLLEHRRPLRAQECRPARKAAGQGRYDLPNPYRRLHFVLDNLNAQLVIPSFRGQRLLGFLVLGARRAARGYHVEEVDALVRLAHECAVSLDNAQRYQALKASAEQLQRAKERLVRQERMVSAGRLAMGLAHEIKNPLAAIKTFTEFLPERYNDPTFRQEFAQVVGKEVDRISRIVQSLSDFAKPVLLKLQTMDVQRVLKETLSLLTNDCLKREIAIHQELEPEPILLPADPSQLKQAFLNLCLNAMDAMPHGGTLTVRCRLQAGEAVIQIADSGCGIAPEHLPVLFEPFFTTKDGGMGLGLAVVKQIIDQHVGTIAVESRPGQGATFTIRLPLAVRLRHHAAAPLVSESRTTGTSTPLLNLEVLVVDDEPKVGVVIKTCFEGLGAKVRTATSGEEALRTISQRPPHVVLLDLALQELDGFEVLRRVRMSYPTLPVIVITGTDGLDVEQQAKELGALACLHKPIELSLLQRELETLVPQLSHH